MTPSRKIAEQKNTEHRSKARTEHRAGSAQRSRPTRRGQGDHPKPARTPDRDSEKAPTSARAAESAPVGNDKLADVSAVLFMALSGVALVLFFVALAIGPNM